MGSIKIKKEKKVKDGKQWLHMVKVCNEGTKDKEVVVTSWPYDTKMKKIGKKKDRPEQTRVIKAGKCEWFVFEFKSEPGKTYTDVYDKDRYDPEKQKGGLLDYTILDDLVAQKLSKSDSGNGNYIVTTPLPYPNRFAYTEEPMEFYIESVTGIPDDWSWELLQPKLGETFVLQPNDREFPAVLSLKAPQNFEEGLVIRPRILQRIVDKPNEPNFVMRHNLFLAVDESGPTLEAQYNPNPENGEIQVHAFAEDQVTGVREVRVRYSEDEGNTWAEKDLSAPFEAYMKDGPNPNEFSGTICRCQNSNSIMVQIIATDEAGNSSETEPVLLG